jgi:hypothetical protein
MSRLESIHTPSNSFILNADDWANIDPSSEGDPIIGPSENPVVRSLTKNLIQAPEKAFKTTFLMRFLLGLSSGETVFLPLPVLRRRRVLYLHGELAVSELRERLQAAANGLKGPLDAFFQGRSLTANLVSAEGQKAVEELVLEYRPEILVFDPWQSFIAGADENSFKDVSSATRFLDKLIAEHGLTIFIVVHVGKNPKRGARGHSLLSGWRDTKIDLKRDGNKVTVNVEPRWAKPPDRMTLMFNEGTLVELGPAVWSEQAKDIRCFVLSSGGKISREELGLRMNLYDSALRMALKRAQDCGAIVLDSDSVTLPKSSSVTPPHSL